MIETCPLRFGTSCSSWRRGCLSALVAGALHAFVPASFLQANLTGRWGVVKGALLGVPMPLCSCAVIPAGLGLKKQGASDGATVAFMISTPQTGADSLLVARAFLGWPFALFTLASSFVLGLIAGWWTDAAGPQASTGVEAGPACELPAVKKRLHAMIEFGVETLRSIWRWLVIGVVASAAIEHFVPPGSLEQLAGHGGVVAMLLAFIVGMPLYVCTTGSVPLAASLVHAGFPPGAALVFLISGPATNIATMGAVYRVLGRRTLAIYLTTIAFGSLAFGFLFNALVDAHAATVPQHLHDHTSWWPTVWAIALVALLGWFAWDDAAAWLRKRRGAADILAPATSARSVEVGVQGMTCGSCVEKLQRLLGREAGVSSVAVTLEPGRAVVHGDVSDERARTGRRGRISRFLKVRRSLRQFDGLFAGAGSQRLPHIDVDAIGDELRRAVCQRRIDPAWMVAAGRMPAVRRVLISVRSQEFG